MPFVALKDVVLYYRVDGPDAAPSVLLVGSLGTDCRIWEDVVAKIRGRCRVLRYDQRGQGLSDGPPGPYSIEAHAADLIALLEHLGWQSAALCGLSIGGMIAMQTYALRPDLVSGLILSDTADVIGPPELWNARIDQVNQGGLEPLIQGAMERWFSASFHREQPAEVRGWANLLLRAPTDGYLGSCAAIRDADLIEFVSDINVPTLCICGSEDLATPPSLVRGLAERIPRAVYVEMEGAGHLPPVERPEEFARHLTDFLEARIGV
jgi:3-oxoadipate enol-lactonase